MCGCWNFAGTTPHHFCRCRGAGRLGKRGIVSATKSSRAGRMRDMGTEVGGILGFTTLRSIDIKVDYRDGLVWMDYQGPPGTLATGLDPK